MLQPTGSVYLDAPARNQRPDPAPETSPRIAIAGVLAAISMVCLTLAAFLGLFRVLIHDPQTVMGAINIALDDPAARPELENEIAVAIEDTLFGEGLAATLAAYDIDLNAEARRIAPLVLDDPAFRAALADLVTTTHERVLLESSDAPLDMTAVTAAVRDTIVREIPEANAVLPDSSTLYIVTADQILDLTAPVELLDRAALAIAAGGLLLPISYLVHPRRHRVVAWAGRWLLMLGLAAGLLAVGLPYLGGRYTGSILVEIAIRDLSVRLLAPAAIAGIIGMGLVSAASIFRTRERYAAADEGVAAALGGLDELSLTGGRAPHMELSQRGLVDVNHPLTNI